MPNRLVSWFSCGAASAVATKLTLAERGHDDVLIAYTDTGSEHPDNARFLADCERWFDHPIEVLKSDEYDDTWDVWERRKFLVSAHGAPCTGLLKKRARFLIQRADDIQVFGYTADPVDAARAVRFREQNPEVDLRTPLIERHLFKADCLAIVEEAGIELPAMYRLGYRNNNCVGCVKGGIGYWNKIRRDFPDVFARMADLEGRLGATVLRADGQPLPLVELDPTRGDHTDEPDIECSLLCHSTLDALAEADVPKEVTQ